MRTQSSLAVSDIIQFHRQQPRTVGTRCLVHQSLRCMLDMCLSRHAVASALRSESDCSLQKNCSECVTAPPRNHRNLRSRIPAGRASHAWLSHAPRATTEANTLRCNAEVPVFVNYLLFFPPTIPWVPDNMVTSNQVWFAIESECCGYMDRFRLCIVCHISIYRRLTGATHVQR